MLNRSYRTAKEKLAMQFYDLIMLAVMGGAILFGLWKGLAWQVASLAAIFVSYFVARNFNEPFANLIGGDPAWNRFLAMFILFMGTSLLIWIAFGFVRHTIEKLHLHSFDRQAGAALGAVKGVILCTLVTLFAVSLLGETTCRQICTSRSGNYIARFIGHLGGVVPDEIGKYIGPYVDRFRQEMDEHGQEMPAPAATSTTTGYPPGPVMEKGYRPDFQNNPSMTRTATPQERLGQLLPVRGGQSGSPEVNGSIRWPAPNQSGGPVPDNGRLRLPDININLPPVDWQRAAGEVLDRTFGGRRE